MAAVRDLTASDLDWVLEINRVHEALLSPLDRNELEALVAGSRLTRGVDPAAAFVIALDQDAAYDSPNFQWFRERYARFLYVDRIAVAADATGAGHGRRLYADLFDRAAALGHDTVCAEIYCNPPNHGSIAFHEREGFAAVGEQHLPDRDKTVRYFARGID